MQTYSPESWFNIERQKTELNLNKLKIQIRKIAFIRLILFIGIIISSFLIFNAHVILGLSLFIISIIGFLSAVKISLKLKKQLLHNETTLNLIQIELDSIAGKPSSIDTGTDLLQLNHPYAHDLDLFGKKSLWHYLNRTLSPDGRNLLAELITNPFAVYNTIQARQNSIAELKSKPDFLLQFRAAGLSEEKNPPALSRLNNWLNETFSFLNHPLVRLGRWIFPAFTLIALLGYLLSFLPVWLLSISIFLNLAVLSRTIRQINQIHNRHSEIGRLIAHHVALVNYTAQQEFQNELLQNAKNAANQSVVAVGELHTLLNRFDIRLNGFMGILLNTFFLFDYHCLFAIETWKLNNRQNLLHSMSQMALLEQWISLGNFAFQRPDFQFPEIKTVGPMHASGLFHPLIHSENVVANTLSLGQDEKLILLTGANMTGKSTWLRAIGLNAVIAYCGLPIAAKSASFPLMRIYTSMRITDDLEEGISYFKAEISRLQSLLSNIRNSDSNWLVLLDEPLRGTNSGDKQAGTIGLITNLLSLPTIGILATHDAALSVLEEKNPGKLQNFHFDSSVSNNELHFDYTLKRGCSISNNATLLMKLNGILLD